MAEKEIKVAKGGSFLTEPTGSYRIFTPEDFTEEQKMFAKTASDFMEKDVFPILERIEHKEKDLLPQLLRKAGELGLLMNDIPEKYGGLGGLKSNTMLLGEKLHTAGSFSVTIGAHTGIGTLPIVYFGNPEQKAKYLPKLATGELISCFCLTETGAGSDAISLKTKATLSADGKHYILNGSKQFITNAGIADLFIVFAKVDGDKFSAFIVEKEGTDGIIIGAEEKKLGLRGSSTTSITFEDAKVPAENLLGRVGRGHKVAFNILNDGRFKLGAGAMGAAKYIFKEAINYAKVRVQFGRPISDFLMIRRKIADMATRIYTGESMAYRVAGMMDEALKDVDRDDAAKVMEIIEEWAIEDALLKVFGTEAISFISDEALQVYGGYGFTEEYPAERVYRDCRIERIFEGTNEINRNLTAGTTLRRASKGQLPLVEVINQTYQELEEKSKARIAKTSGPLAWEIRAAELAKRIALYTIGLAIQRYGPSVLAKRMNFGNPSEEVLQNGSTIMDRQDIVEIISNMIIDVYAMDSVCARTLQIIDDRGKAKTRVQMAVTQTVCQEGYDRVDLAARTVITAATGSDAKKHLKNLEKLGTKGRANIVESKQVVADHFIEAENYDLSS